MTNIQDITDNTLFRVITESGDVHWNFLALKVIISRLKLKLRMANDSSEALQECYVELRELFRRSGNIPSAKEDMRIVVERFGNNVKRTV